MDLSNAEWHKSTLSQGDGNNCVEVALNLPGIVAIRDSKAPNEPSLIFTPSAWSAFIDNIQNGQLD
ncbi:DUF397 domain-containing protein [Streptosporangium sp. NBC_01755]|uniref:DUF397 domain-containing protein n=1 Tax=unclassified Streptosporangium TaxID=2632669 RepID=UPI002DDB5A6E|nr:MULTISPECIES: DUF397 domain-containing protein [unclassified Streptosporangium]WSA27813.1 DUF397 domain-containing protein [Streptosporangium sp. NBC_01810]WSD00712.1 DUF397 domain-containing protein [Streptosporangium sp. NBC_01755]